MKKLNCWEFKKCGRAPEGENAGQSGVCPAATDRQYDGLHGGTNGGRACWLVAGTMCNGEVKGTFALKFRDCAICDFYCMVREEEGIRFRGEKDKKK
jgi:hypothetical protein